MTAGDLAAEPLSARLRRETRDAHEAVEAAFDWERRLSTVPGYREVLGRLHGFHAGWEPAIAAVLADPNVTGPRAKLALIVADLHALGASPEEVDRLPVCRPPGLSAEQATGALYVLEGATLGGQVIARHLRERLGVTADGGGRFYAAYGKQTGAMWRACRDHLDATPAGMHDGVVQGALLTFAAMEGWLDGQDRRQTASLQPVGHPA